MCVVPVTAVVVLAVGVQEARGAPSGCAAALRAAASGQGATTGAALLAAQGSTGSGSRDGEADEAQAGPAVVAVTPRGAPVDGIPTVRLQLKHDRSVQLRRQTFRVEGVAASEVRVGLTGDVADATTSRVLPVDDGQVLSRVTDSPVEGMVNVRVCFDPTGPGEVHPGRYEGAFMVAAPGVPPVPVAVEVVVGDNRWWRAALAALLGLLAGLAVRVGREPPTAGWRRYLGSKRLWLTAGGGVATAVYSFLTIFENDPVFDASLGNLWRLTAEVFAGTLASKAATDLLSPPGEQQQTAVGGAGVVAPSPR